MNHQIGNRSLSGINFGLLLTLNLLFAICTPGTRQVIPLADSLEISKWILNQHDSVPQVFLEIKRDVPMKDYFNFMDSLLKKNEVGSNLTDYLIVHGNPWILDSLRNSDYYIKKKKGFFQYDQREEMILRKGDRLVLPDSSCIANINRKLQSTILDINIPEYKLRIIQLGDTVFSCKIRVGRPAIKYLAVVGHDVNLQTPVGEGEIIRIERSPYYINPDDGKRYDSTMRDDGKYTKMPIIPWLEPSINGIRYGDLIHATTNISTLGKAYSHGCIGTSESDAWMIYYNSPIGTKVVFRYDLRVKNRKGDSLLLKDIYHLKTVP